MKLFFVGPQSFVAKVTGGQRRFLEAQRCCGVGGEQIVSGFWGAIKLILVRDATYVAFDERYLFSCILLLLTRKRFIFFPRGNKLVHFKYSYGRLRLWVYKKLFGWLYSKCDLLVFQTKAQAEEFQEMYFYKGPYEVLYNNINVSWIDEMVSLCDFDKFSYSPVKNNKRSYPQDASGWSVGFMGGVDKRKGFDVAYEALIELISAGLVQFHVAGADVSVFEKYDVVPHGFVSGRDIAVFYKRCDFIVIPSEYDSFPNVLLEALVCGSIPLITRDRITEEILGEKSILLFDRNAVNIRKQVLLLMNNPVALRCARIECANLLARYSFDWCARIRSIVGI